MAYRGNPPKKYTQGGYFDGRADKAKSVMESLTSRCYECGVMSSKTPLYDMGDRKLCGRCLPEGTTPADVAEEAEKYRAHLEAEAKKPKPESFGEWS